MANPSTVSAPTPSEAAQATRRYVDRIGKVNRELIDLWTSCAEGGLETVFSLQTAAVETGQTWLDSSARLAKDALKTWADLARTAQSTTLKSYQAGGALLRTEAGE
jgi:hypothetical protein